MSSLGARPLDVRGAQLAAMFRSTLQARVCERGRRFVPLAVYDVCWRVLVRSMLAAFARGFGCAARGGQGERRRTSGPSARRRVCGFASALINRSIAAGSSPRSLGAGGRPRAARTRRVPPPGDVGVNSRRLLGEETHPSAREATSYLVPERPGEAHARRARATRSKGRYFGCLVP
jgi:hypothetical protein